MSYRAEDYCGIVEKRFYFIQSGGLSWCSRKEGSIPYRAYDCRDVVEKKVSITYRAEDCRDVVENKVLYHT